jgi:hypothetical protein
VLKDFEPETAMPDDQFESHLAMLLRDQPRGTTADLTDFAVAYWDGVRVRYVFLHEDGDGSLDEEFEFSDYLLVQWETDLQEWLDAPRFTVGRPELLQWLKESPPNEAG